MSLRIDAGEYLAIRGPSGCGKSTLLHILGCVDTPTSGTLLFDGRSVGTLPDAERSTLRLRSIGFVFQRFFLLPMLTASENVEVPQAEAGVGRRERRRRTAEPLEYVGLAQRADHRPSQLAGGEAQRVAMRARWRTVRGCCSPTSRRRARPRHRRARSPRCSIASSPTAPPSSSSSHDAAITARAARARC